MRLKMIALVAVLGIVAGACTAVSTTTTTPASLTRPGGGDAPRGLEIFAASALQPFDSCGDFLAYVKRNALELVGPYGFGGYGAFTYATTDVAIAEESAAQRGATTTIADGASIEGVDYSGTNTQVAGVDEPDLVKTDGERIFVVAQGRLYWIDASGVPEIVASIPLDGWGQQLFLSGNRLLVMTSGGGYNTAAILEDRIAPSPGQWPSDRTNLVEVDVSDPSSMQAIRTLTLDGTIVSSRMADGTIRVVIRSQPTGFAWAYPEGGGIRAERKAVEANKELIGLSTLENWVPWYVLEDAELGTTSDGPLLGCDQVGYPDEFSGLAMLTVLSIELDSGLQPGNGIGLLAEGQTVYASRDNLYVATTPWAAWPRIAAAEGALTPEVPTTAIHMFDITDPTTATYVASGEVEGTLLSQWSIDEYESTLRVVVTDEIPWGSAGRSIETPDTSVVTLQRSGDQLVQIGSVDGLGKNERVYGVRFIGDRGYVVTFRQVDPLYVLDLADPRNPQVTGELKINGYSAYLHPIGEDLLLGVGQDATTQGRVLGTQVSVFDVSDAANPRRLSRLTFNESQSQAEWDAKAFLWWAPSGISVLPMQRWSWDEQSGTEDYFSGAVVVSVTTQSVKQIGVIEHPNAFEEECPDCGGWTAPIVRSLVIGDRLYTVSESGILASTLDTLEEVAWIPFN